jgi:hypothetical protein
MSNLELRPRPVAVLCTLVLLVVLAVPSGAAPAAGVVHCQVSVIGQTPAGQLVLGPVQCGAGGQMTLLSTVATHYNGPGGSGMSLAVYGASCDGSWMNMPAGFNNSISSTWSLCTVRHHDGIGLGGASQITGPGGPTTLNTLDNRTSSAIYY